MTPLTWVFSGVDGFVVYRGREVVLSVADPLEAMRFAGELLTTTPAIHGEIIADRRRRVSMASDLLKVAAITSE